MECTPSRTRGDWPLQSTLCRLGQPTEHTGESASSTVTRFSSNQSGFVFRKDHRSEGLSIQGLVRKVELLKIETHRKKEILQRLVGLAAAKKMKRD